MKQLHEDATESYVKALVYGKPGTGKTSFGVTAPKPLILLSERQGFTHIKQAAARLGKPVPPVLLIESAHDLRHVARGVHAASKSDSAELVVHDENGRELYRGPRPETLVIDSITDVFRLLDEEIKRDAPPRKGRDGLDVVSERYWLMLQDRGEKIVRGFRNLPCHVLFLALEDEKTAGEGDQAERSVMPSVPMRKMPSMLAAAVNVVGVTMRAIKPPREGKKEDARVLYGIRTVGPSHYLLKPCRPLRDTEVPDFSSWVERLLDPKLLAPATGLEENADDTAGASGDDEGNADVGEKPTTNDAPAARRARRNPKTEATNQET